MSAFAAIAVDMDTDTMRLGDVTLPLRVQWSTAVAEVTLGDKSYRLRPWTFGERRRLLAAHLDPQGELAVETLADRATTALVDPQADGADREVLGLAALAWSAMVGAQIPAPTPGVDPATQAVRLAGVTGWSPTDIDNALAADVDRWFGAARADNGRPHQHTEDETDGFRTFQLED